MDRVTFPNKPADPFTDEVKIRVGEYFATRKLSTKANFSMVLKTIILLTVTFGSYGLILSGMFPPLAMLGLAVLMGVGVAGIGFGIAHDAQHGAYSSKPWVNKMLGLAFDMLGANGYMWRLTHNVIHHTYTNVHGLDEDLEVSPLIRLSPQAEWKPYHRFQHLYVLFLYSLSTLSWLVLKDIKYFAQRDLGPYKNAKHPVISLVGMIAGKLFYVGWAIVIPLLVLPIPWWQFAIGFLVMHLTAGLILGVIFQLAHVVEETEHPIPDAGGNIDQAWMLHEMVTTANFDCDSKFLCWYLGGLNFQVDLVTHLALGVFGLVGKINVRERNLLREGRKEGCARFLLHFVLHIHELENLRRRAQGLLEIVVEQGKLADRVVELEDGDDEGYEGLRLHCAMDNLFPSKQKQQGQRNGANDVHERRTDGGSSYRAQVGAEQALGSPAESGELPGLHAESFHDPIAGNGLVKDVLDVGEFVLAFTRGGAGTSADLARRKNDERNKQDKQPGQLPSQHDDNCHSKNEGEELLQRFGENIRHRELNALNVVDDR